MHPACSPSKSLTGVSQCHDAAGGSIHGGRQPLEKHHDEPLRLSAT